MAPSTLRVGEEFSLGVKVLTEPYFVGASCYNKFPAVKSRYNVSPRGISYMDNVLPEWKGRVIIEGDEGYQGPTDYSFEDHSGPYPGDARPICRIEGLKFITLKEPHNGLVRTSNPILVSDDDLPERLYWADIHSQTFFSDGLRCPEELYSFARDEAFLVERSMASTSSMRCLSDIASA